MLINYSHHASDETSCNACLRMLEWGLEEEKTFGVHCTPLAITINLSTYLHFNHFGEI